MTDLYDSKKRRGAMLVGIFGLALSSVLLLCGAGSVPVEDFAPQGALQSDLNLGGHSLTNAATVDATNVVVSGSLTAPANFSLTFAQVSGLPTTLTGYGITDPVVLTNGTYANPAWLTSLAYSKLTGAPTIPSAQVNSDWSATSGPAQILNKPALATVATTGSYNDLSSKPTIPAPIALTTSGTSGAATLSAGILNIPIYGSGSAGVSTFNTRTGAVTLTAADVNAVAPTVLGTVTSGAIPYALVTGTPTIPAAQVNSDWTATSGLAQILNKPALSSVATSGSYSDLSNKPTLPSVASTSAVLKGNGTGGAVGATAGTDFDAAGAAATAQSAAITTAEAFSASAANITSGSLPVARLSLLLSTANTFTATQSAPDLATPTGPYNVSIVCAGDSRTGGPNGVPNSTYCYRNGAGYASLWPASLQESSFGYNAAVYNAGIASTGIAWGNLVYTNNGIATTGSLTANSNSVVVASASGLTTGMYIAGPGIPYGTVIQSISGTTLTLLNGGSGAPKPTLTQTGAALSFASPVNYSSMGNGYAYGPTMHQLSPASNTGTYTCTTTTGSSTVTLNSGTWTLATGSKVSGNGIPANTYVGTTAPAAFTMVNASGAPVTLTCSGASSVAVTSVPSALLIVTYGINDTQVDAPTCAMTNGSATFTVASTFFYPVGTTISGSGFAAGTVINAVSSVTGNNNYTITASSNWTSSSGNSVITLTPSLSAWETAYSNFVSNAVSDGYSVVVGTILPAYGGVQAATAANTFRIAANAWILSTYGGGAVAGVTTCDLAGNLSAFSYFNPQIYTGDGLHFQPWGNTLIADLLTTTLGLQFPTMQTGSPLFTTQNQSIPWDRIVQPIYSPYFTTASGTNIAANFSSPTMSQDYLVFGNSVNGNAKFGSVNGNQWLFANGALAYLTPSGTSDVVCTPQAGMTVSGTVGGTAIFNETMATTGRKEVVVLCNGLNGTATFNFPTAFTNLPVTLSTSGPATSVVTSLSTTAVTVTGSSTTGPLFLEGY